MNEKEKAIIEMISQNPFLTQKEMAEAINVSRPALANLISGLVKQGKIAGRAYILQQEKEIHCIGGANVDNKYHLQQNVQLGSSNPANVTKSVGGVARNIAENLGRLGHKVRLFTTAGNDADWQTIEASSQSFMNLQSIKQLSNHTTGSYSAVIDPTGELVLAIANMDVYEELTPTYLQRFDTLFNGCPLVVVDLNCPKETIQYIKEIAREKEIPLAIVPVSSPKMNRMPDDLYGVTWLICNLDEADIYLEMKIQTVEDFHQAIKRFLEKGVINVVITAGSKGVFVGSKEQQIFHLAARKTSSIEDVTGAGDSFVGATLHAWLDGMTIHQSIKTGLLNASKTLASPYTVRTDLSAARLTKEMEEY
ncbi:carbohydrate kinase [Paenisporosarcina sp. TG20]|uniref:carbohydrate kinase n=1 Tax=Paenisporosarcina sp. TG20 TaxID=1211706 RepID=UPI0002F0DDA3|nr:carbohydrate kinase [Paenisporosarcina sp. TG20]